MSSSDNRRRSRTQSLPPSPIAEVEENDPNDFIDKILEDEEQIHFDYEGDSETHKFSRNPFTVAKEEIAQARRLNEKMRISGELIESSELSPTSTSSNENSSNPSLLGSIYSMGEAVFSFIRGTVKCGYYRAYSLLSFFRTH